MAIDLAALSTLPRKPIISVLKRTPLFEGLYDSEYEVLLDACELVTVENGDILFKAGETARELYVLLGGEINIEHDDHSPIDTLQPGAVLGEMGTVRAAPRCASAIAREKSVLIRIRSSDLDKMVGTAPRVSYLIMRNIVHSLADRLDLANARLHEK